MKTQLKFVVLFLFYLPLFSQSDCQPIPEVNFPGGRVVMTFDGNVHDDDDIVAMPISLGLWWAAGLQDNLVQLEYNNHVCNTEVSENDGSGAGAGDDSQNMRNSASGAMNRFGYKNAIFYDYEKQGSSSTSKMASEIERSTGSNPLYIIAGGPMETIWRGLESASGGFGNVTIISHSSWNESHKDCNGHTWNDLKSKYQSKGVTFVGFCGSGSSCSGPLDLVDQNIKLSTPLSSWSWLKNSSREYNNYLYGRNPFGTEKFDPSDAGMVYFLLSGGPYKNGNRKPTVGDFQKLLENPCGNSAPAPAPAENTPPSLTFMEPLADEVIATGSTLMVAFDASDSDGQVVKHETYVNGVLMDDDGLNYSPYTQTNIKAGTYKLKAVITDDDGAVTTKSITVSVREPESTPPKETSPPSLSIASPYDTQVVTAGSSLTVNFTASDADGKIVKYQVFVDGTLVDDDGETYSPYQLTDIDKGSHTVRVEVVDNDGEKTVKSISFTAEAEQTPVPENNEAPSVTIDAPKDNLVVSTGSSLAVELSASDADGNIAQYQVFVDGELVDNDGTNYSEYELKNIGKGSHTIRVVVTDDDGEKTAATVSITAETETGSDPPSTPAGNMAPELSIIAPRDGQSIDAGSSLSVELSASDTDGKIVQHEVFLDGSLVDNDGSAYSPYEVKNIGKGTHTLRVVVTDDDGEKTAESISFTAEATAQPEQPATPAGNGSPTLAIVTPKDGQTVKAGSSLEVELSTSDQDGKIVLHQVYLDGHLVDTDGNRYTPYRLKNIRKGTHSIKVEVRDNDGNKTSESISFMAEGGEVTETPQSTSGDSAPTLAISSPFEGQIVDAGSSLNITLSASDKDGKIVKHQVYVDGRLVDTDGANYTSYQMKNVKKGNHTIRVKVTDNDGEKAVQSVTFIAGGGASENLSEPAGDTAPILVIESPLNDENFAVGGTVTVEVSASDRNGKVVKHQVFLDGRLVDTDGESYTPYRIDKISKGPHTIEVEVTDNDGQKTLKSIHITAGDRENEAPTLSITSPEEGAHIKAGSDVTIALEGSDADGEIVTYQIFVNDRLADTDGSGFTPYTLRDTEGGNYSIEAVAIDNNGATTRRSISFTVGESSGKNSAAATLSEGTTSDELAFPGAGSKGPYAIVAPNPVVGKMIHLHQKGYDYLKIIDLSGVVLKTIITDQRDMEINVSELAPGIYILAGTGYSSKFVLEEE